MTEIHDPLKKITDFFVNVMNCILLNSILLFLNVAFSLQTINASIWSLISINANSVTWSKILWATEN